MGTLKCEECLTRALTYTTSSNIAEMTGTAASAATDGFRLVYFINDSLNLPVSLVGMVAVFAWWLAAVLCSFLL